jgi:hypothetical protein
VAPGHCAARLQLVCCDLLWLERVLLAQLRRVLRQLVFYFFSAFRRWVICSR